MAEKILNNLFDYFEESETDSVKFAYALLITRKSYANDKSADGFLTVLAKRYDGVTANWSFNDLESMFEWLGSSLTFGFSEEKPEWIEDRLFEEIIRYEKSRIRVGARMIDPEYQGESLKKITMALVGMLHNEDSLQDAQAYIQDLVQLEAQGEKS